MSVDKGHSPPITTSPPLAAVPIQSQPPPSSALPVVAEPTASYEDVVSDENLFLATLEALHRSLGTKFMVPRVGGKPLNLHRLFVEVTSRGGLQRMSFVMMVASLPSRENDCGCSDGAGLAESAHVIRDRIWKDVISAFNFPSTITNASFVLRKYYISLLQHYEEAYFFRNKDQTDPITGANHGSPSVSKPNQVGTTGTHDTSGKHLADPSFGEVLIDQEPLKQQDPTKIAQLKNSTGLHLPGYPPLEIGSWLRGEITGKFENGYLVTAIYGSEKLTGVLYHTHFDASQSQPLSSSSSGQRGRKRSSRAMDDPSLSKSNSSNLHLDHGVKVNPSLSTEEKKISKQLGDLWNRLTQPSNEDNQETESDG